MEEFPNPKPVSSDPSTIFSLSPFKIPASRYPKAFSHRNFVYWLEFLLSNASVDCAQASMKAFF